MDHIIVFATLIAVLILFLWGRFRYDFVALFALFTLVIAGIISAEDAFLGFGHPAVITVAVVLIIGRALEHSGVVDLLGEWVSGVGDKLVLQILALSLLVAFASAFMNNIGALAILMPVALNIAKKSGNPPSYLLMPIAFASLLGGMITLFGTPPNIIISTIRAKEAGSGFAMFDFAPVGIVLTVAGVAFLTLIGWRFLPKRTAKQSQSATFEIEAYVTEVKVPEDSELIGTEIRDWEKITDADVQLLGIVRNNNRIHAPDDDESLIAGDILIIECDTDDLKQFIEDSETELVGDRKFRKDAVGSRNIVISEVVVMAESPLIGQTTAKLRMRTRFGVNLLAVARRGKQIHKRIDHVVFKVGDVLMLQGRAQTIDEKVSSMGCLPLAKRAIRIGFEKRIAVTVSIFAISILLVVLNVLPVHISFAMAAGAIVWSGALPLKEMYSSVDWPVIVLLGAMLPVGAALETTGGADIIAGLILSVADQLPVWATIGVLLAVTMVLSGVINNAATVVLMAPIGISIAKGLELSIDPFLMAIAIGASASFLTPIGHQSNTLVMGPGGYRFGDYFRMGLPMSILVVVLAIPLILYFWPV